MQWDKYWRYGILHSVVKWKQTKLTYVTSFLYQKATSNADVKHI